MGSLDSLARQARVSGDTMGRVGSVSILLLLVSSVIVPPASSAPIVAVTGGVTLASLPLQALVLGKLLFLKKLLLEGVLLDKLVRKGGKLVGKGGKLVGKGVLLDKILRKSSSSSDAQGYNAPNS